MGGFREIRAAMRNDVHETMSVDALYIESPGATPIPCTVRVHEQVASHGALQGTNFHYAERAEMDISLRFKLSEIEFTPVRNAIVSIAVGEAYRIDHCDPVDAGYQSCPSLRLDAQDSDGLPVPEV